ncbi:MAG: 7-cyano-7-deazaguanine synthase [Labilithrix sp.]|nr:7-cyano-7-deazaguanine synthase [Labilithrix sp.]
MDTSDPWIEFDADGNCNHCNFFLSAKLDLLSRDPSETKPLDDLLGNIKASRSRSKYDVVVGMSGGVDSSYVAVLAARHGLRVLAVHLDNGWNSPVAVENINRLVSRLNLGYASCVLPWSDFRRVQVAFLKASVPEAETPTDIAIARALFDSATKHGVNRILSGGNLASEGILPISWHYNARDTRYSHAILRRDSCPLRLFNTMRCGLRQEVYFRVVRQIKTLYPLNSIVYDKAEARKELEQDFGWKYYGSKHGESRFTRFIQTYYLPVKHGIDYRRATFSSEICLGQFDRSHALKLLAEPPYDKTAIKDELKYIAKKLALSLVELENIVEAPPRWYTDFPNDEALLGRVYDAYRFLAGKRKVSAF